MLFLEGKNGTFARKLGTCFLALQSLNIKYCIQIIQPVPDDLGILAHYVSIYPLAPQCDNSCATLVHVQLRIHPATTWDLGKQNKNILDTVFDDSALKLSLKYEYLWHIK